MISYNLYIICYMISFTLYSLYYNYDELYLLFIKTLPYFWYQFKLLVRTLFGYRHYKPAMPMI